MTLKHLIDYSCETTFWVAVTIGLCNEDDQIVPYADTGPPSVKLLKHCTLKTYKDFPHGMPTTEAERINADLLAFLQS
jgi:non-heme chloroperoxidase